MTAEPRASSVGRVSTPPPGLETPQAPGYPPGQGADYDAGIKVAGALFTAVLPFFSLIAALALRGAEANPLRRASLRTWAIVSGAWLAAQVLVAVIAIASIAHSVPQVDHSGPCIGGPAPGAEGVPVGNGNYRFDCVGGGSTIVHAP